MDVMTSMGRVLEEPFYRAKELKAAGQKVVGVTPMYFPEEMIHAGNAVPVVLQESNEPITSGFAHLYHFFCGFTRCNVDLGVRGELGFCDAIVSGDMCIQMRHLAKTLKRNMTATPIVFLSWPLEASERFFPAVRDRLGRTQQRLEELLGRKIDDASLKQSIAIFNRNRALMRRVYELRRKNPGVLRAREMLALVKASMVMPKEEHSAMLEKLIPELEKKPARRDGKVKLYLAGHLCQATKVEILDLVEEAGGAVVWDDLYTGYRYVASDVPTDRPPLDALAWRYLNLTVPCPTRTELKKEWADHVIENVKESGASGVVTFMLKQCCPHLLYQPYFQDMLEKAGIPNTLIISEHEIVSLEGTRTRLQAFVEMLRKGV